MRPGRRNRKSVFGRHSRLRAVEDSPIQQQLLVAIATDQTYAGDLAGARRVVE